MGALSAILFVLGNVLLFHPLPRPSQQTCYHSAPLLWWGVMTVTGVGWFLLVQVFVVVVVVGVGGQAVLVSIQLIIHPSDLGILIHTIGSAAIDRIGSACA